MGDGVFLSTSCSLCSLRVCASCLGTPNKSINTLPTPSYSPKLRLLKLRGFTPRPTLSPTNPPTSQPQHPNPNPNPHPCQLPQTSNQPSPLPSGKRRSGCVVSVRLAAWLRRQHLRPGLLLRPDRPHDLPVPANQQQMPSPGLPRGHILLLRAVRLQRRHRPHHRHKCAQALLQKATVPIVNSC